MRNIALFTLVVILMACNTDNSITTPEVDNSVYLMTIESGVGHSEGTVYTTFGTLPTMNLSDQWLGLEWLPPGQGGQNTTRALVLDPGDLIAIGLVNTAPSWISSQGGSYQYFSDWSATAIAGDGVTYSDASDVSLFVNIYQSDDYTLVDTEIVGGEAVGKAIAYKTSFPEDGFVRQVFSRQTKVFGCHGDGGLLMRSSSGLATVVTGAFSYASAGTKVPAVTVNCKKYESITAAQAAIARLQFKP